MIIKKGLHIFFAGIGGIGMSGIAEILLQQGYKVSGSDRQLSEITEYLQQKGAVIYEGHRAENVQDVDLLVYSSAVPVNNPERQRAREKGIREIRRAEMLSDMIRTKYCIAIAGTHGKTTTTSLCGEVLLGCGLDPTIIVGGRLKSLKTNARLGKGEFVVVEADEYDRSFLALTPTIAVITNLEADHLDCYKDLPDIKQTFLTFANKIPFYGSVVCCLDEPVIREILPQIKGEVITYGFDKKADFSAQNIQFSESRSSFEVYKKGNYLGKLNQQIPGTHNVKNSLAVIAVSSILDLNFADVKASLEKFTGVERRFEIKFNKRDILIVDDYAHHPTEIEATLLSASKGWKKRVIAVFQPHLYSRTRDFRQEFARALNLADVVVLTDIYPAREEPISGINGETLVDELKKSRKNNLYYVQDKNKLPEFLLEFAKSGDMVITIGAGDIFKAGDKLSQLLQE